MKLWQKIVLYSVLSILVLMALAFVFRGEIISYALETLIKNKSEGRVTLKIDQFDLGVDGTIVIEKPELLMKDVFLNESKSMSMDRIFFNRIEIKLLDLYVLIFDGNITATKFLVDKPEFYFTETGTATKSSFHPEKLISALNYNPGLFKALQVQIGDVEIHYGSITVSEYVSPDADPGVVDFTFMLHDFNSNLKSDSTTGRILYSDEIRLKIKDLHRVLKSGYTLTMDSAVFSSKKRDVEVSGFALVPSEENLENNAVGLSAGGLVLNDIDLEEVRGLEDLSLSAVHLSDGHFTTFRTNKVAEKKEHDSTNIREPLEKMLYGFTVDSISINHFEYFNIQDLSDTTIAADDINFLITRIEIDSGMFSDPFRKFDYDRIRLSTGHLELNKLIEGFNVKYDGLSYSNDDWVLNITGISLDSDTTSGARDKINAKLPELNIQGFSLRHFQQKEKQKLSIAIVDPEINIDIEKLINGKKSKNGKPVFPDYIQLEHVRIENGNINLKNKDLLGVSLLGLDIDVLNIHLPDELDTTFRYNGLSFNYDQVTAQIDNNKYQITTGKLTYEKQELLLSNIDASFLLDENGLPVEFTADYIELNKFDLDKLISGDRMLIRAVKLSRPFIKGNIKLPEKNEEMASSKQKKKSLIPHGFRFGSLKLIDGKIDATIDIKDEQLKLLTDFDVEIGKLSVWKGQPVSEIVKKILWDVQLNKTKASYQNHNLQLKSLTSNSFKSEFGIDSLSIKSAVHLVKDENKLVVRNLFLPLLDINGLDYPLLIFEDSLKFRSLAIENPSLDLVLPKAKKQKPPSDQNHKINLRPYLIVNYDSISLTKMSLSIEQPADSSYHFIRMENLGLGHIMNYKKAKNLIETVVFDFEHFSFIDTISGKYYKVDKGFVDPIKKSFILDGVASSDRIESKSKDDHISPVGYEFKSSKIGFDHIFIKNELPSNIKIGKLFIEDLELDIHAGEPKAEKEPIKVNLEVINKFTEIMTRLQVDTAELNNIDMRYGNVNDGAPHLFKFDSIALIMHEIDIDTSMIGHPDPHLIDRLTLNLRGRTHVTGDSLYELKTGQIHYNFPERRVTIDSFYVKPRYPDSIFFKKAVYQTDRVDMFGKKIEIDHIDINELIVNNHLHLNSLSLHEFKVSMYRDKRFPFRPGQYKKMPREMIMGIQQKFTADSLRLINSYLDYKEFDLKSESAGEIFLSDFNIAAYGMTNQITEGERKAQIKLDLNARIMGDSRMDIAMFFPLYPDSVAFWLSGKTEEIDLTVFNSMTENLLGIGITEGRGSVDIPLIVANDSVSKGTMIFKYKTMRLALYNRKKAELNPSFFSPVVNFFLNDLVMRSNNPRFARKAKTGIVYFERDTRKGIVNYAWKSVLSGMLSTVGINKKGQKQERKDIKKAE